MVDADTESGGPLRERVTALASQGLGRLDRVPGWLWTALALLVGVGLTISRRPDVVTYPQLWAEDGRVFFLQAYQMGLGASLLHPYAGYLQLAPRLAVGIGMIFGLARLPLVLNLSGLLIQAAPAAFLVSDRCQPLVSRRALRWLLALVYLGLPNTAEIDVNITNAQWHLAVLAVLVLLAPRSSSGAARAFDAVVLLLSGLSGPFAILLVPCALALTLVRRTKRQLLLAALVVATALAEGLTLVANGLGQSGSSPHLPLQLQTLLQVLDERILIIPLLGVGEATRIDSSRVFASPTMDAFILVVGVGLGVAAFLRGTTELRVLLTFSALVMASSMVRLESILPLVIAPGGAGRYFFIPMLGWIAALAFGLATLRRQPVAWAGLGIVALLLLVAMVSSWEYPPLPRSHFYSAAAQFAAATAGQPVLIPENPANWDFTVVKR